MMRQILVFATVLFTLSFVVSGQPGFTIYKLSLQWQPSICSVAPSTKPCINKAEERFTIHGLWPQSPGDVPVSPYKINPKCTAITPVPIGTQLQPIEVELNKNWPDLFNKISSGFWTYEWEQHGMCSDYPDKPLYYFQKALELQKKFINLPKDAGITLGTKFTAGVLLEKVKAKFGVYPQLTCNKLKTNIQLMEIRFCYQRVMVLQDCPCRLSGACRNDHDQIVLPKATAPAPPPPKRYQTVEIQ